MNIVAQVLGSSPLLATLLGLGDVSTVELSELGLQGLLGLSGRNDNLLDQTISDESVLWLDLHLQVLGVVEEASSDTSAATELGSEVEQSNLVQRNTPLVRNSLLEFLKIGGSGLRVVNFKVLDEARTLPVVFCSRVCC